MEHIFFALFSVITICFFWVACLFGQPTILYSNGVGDFNSFDPVSCESAYLFTAKFPPHFKEEESFISGITLDREGKILAVNGTHLMHIDSSTGDVEVVDSLITDKQLGEWLSIATSHDGTIYLGTHGFYTYDLLEREIIGKPELFYGFLPYYGGDMGWYRTYLLNYSRFFHYVGLHNPINQELVWSVDVPIRDAFFGITSVFRDCEHGSIYGFRADEDSTIVMRFMKGESDYDTLCVIKDGILGGMTSLYEQPKRLLNLEGNHISHDLYGNHTVSIFADCSDTLSNFLRLQIKKCYNIDSISLSTTTGIIVVGADMHANEKGQYIWKNDQSWDDALISNWINDLKLIFTQPKPSYIIYVGIYSQGFRSPLNIDVTRNIDGCFEEYKDFYIPNAFSPNGDGINDFFEVYVADHIDIEEFKIYSLYSQLVYDLKENATASWNASNLHPGVFIYSAIFKDKLTKRTFEKQGTIHLLK